MRFILCALVVTVLATGCDQASKHYATETLSAEHGVDGAATRVIVPDTFELRYAENPGAAFSMLDSLPREVRTSLFTLTALLALFALAMFLFKHRTAFHTIAVSLIGAGALGNLIDRLRFGYVVDFLYVHLGNAFHYPIFNVADVFIFVGAVLLLLAPGYSKALRGSVTV